MAISLLRCLDNHRRLANLYLQLLPNLCACKNAQVLMRTFTQVPTAVPYVLDPGLEKMRLDMSLHSELFPHLHPGVLARRLKPKCPEQLHVACRNIIEKYPIRGLESKAHTMQTSLERRKRPMGDDELRYLASVYKKHTIQADQMNNDSRMCAVDIDSLSVDESERYEKELEEEVHINIEQDQWKPVKWDTTSAICSVADMLPLNFNILWQLFYEIRQRDKHFHPKSVLDFGSGLASSVWAVNQIWPHLIQDHFCIDSSADMNELAELLLKDPSDKSKLVYDNVHFRNSMPLSLDKLDLVVSAFSLFELPSQAARLNTLQDLWNRTESYLVLVELGNHNGHKCLMEARSYLLHLNDNENMSAVERQQSTGYVFSPCPHDKDCPLLKINMHEREENCTPCAFGISTKTFLPKVDGEQRQWTFPEVSYVVMKKGSRPNLQVDWPRALRKSASHPDVELDLRKYRILACTPNGEIKEPIISKENSDDDVFNVAKFTLARDLLPLVDPNSPAMHRKAEWTKHPLSKRNWTLSAEGDIQSRKPWIHPKKPMDPKMFTLTDEELPDAMIHSTLASDSNIVYDLQKPKHVYSGPIHGDLDDDLEDEEKYEDYDFHYHGIHCHDENAGPDVDDDSDDNDSDEDDDYHDVQNNDNEGLVNNEKFYFHRPEDDATEYDEAAMDKPEERDFIYRPDDLPDAASYEPIRAGKTKPSFVDERSYDDDEVKKFYERLEDHDPEDEDQSIDIKEIVINENFNFLGKHKPH